MQHPMRPEVAAGLLGDERHGRWHALRADFPNDAYTHARDQGQHGSAHTVRVGDCEACSVEVIGARRPRSDPRRRKYLRRRLAGCSPACRAQPVHATQDRARLTRPSTDPVAGKSDACRTPDVGLGLCLSVGRPWDLPQEKRANRARGRNRRAPLPDEGGPRGSRARHSAPIQWAPWSTRRRTTCYCATFSTCIRRQRRGSVRASRISVSPERRGVTTSAPPATR